MKGVTRIRMRIRLSSKVRYVRNYSLMNMISQAIKLTIAVESEDESLTGETDESYTIDIQKSPGKKVNCEESKCGINLCIVQCPPN